MTGTGPREFMCFSVADAALDGLTNVLRRYPRLGTIRIHGSTSRFTGESIENISQLTRLSYLSLNVAGKSSITGSELAPLSKCKCLKLLSLQSALHDDDGVNAIGKCLSLWS